jgi:hypothetical protein
MNEFLRKKSNINFKSIMKLKCFWSTPEFKVGTHKQIIVMVTHKHIIMVFGL